MSLEQPSARSGIHVVFELGGIVNGSQVNIEGTGSIDKDSATIELDLDAGPKRRALHWDPKLVVLGSLDGLFLATAPMGDEPKCDRLAWLFGSDNIPVYLDTRVTFFDEDGCCVGSTVVSSVLRRDGVNEHEPALDLRAQLVEARFQFLPTERVTGFDVSNRVSIMAASNSSPWTVMTSAWTCDTNFGRTYRALTVSSFEVGSERGVAAGAGTFEIECAPQPGKDLGFSIAISSL